MIIAKIHDGAAEKLLKKIFPIVHMDPDLS